MSRSIVQLAADLGSFNNIGTDVALEKIRAGLVGEIEPLRSLGVNINAVMVQQKALNMGLAETAKELTAADKAQASYALILEQTTNAQGDFARNADEAANSLKTAQASVDDLKASIGTGLTPVVALGAQQVTILADSVTTLADAFNTLGGAIPGTSGEFNLLKSLFESSNPVLNTFSGGMETLSGWLDRGGESGSELVPVIHAVADAMRDATGSGNIFQQVVTRIREEFQDSLELYSEAAGLLAKVGNESEAGGASLDKFGGAFGRQAEMAGLANERNTEFFHTLELGSGKAAEMAFHVAKVAEAQQLLADAYQDGLRGMELFNQQSSEYAGIQSTLEKGYEIVLKKQEEGVKLTDEEQQLLDRYPELYGRLEGAQEDATTQAALFAGANAEVMIAQDELNAAIARGEGNLDPYIQRLNDAKALVGDQAYADPMIGSINTLTDTVTTKLVPAIEDMTRKIEYISKPWLIQIDAATEAAERELLRILELINQINSSNAAPYMPGVGDPGGGQAFADGGLVNGPTFAMIGEAGPELVLPLTRPDRMRELLRQAGFPMMADGGGAGFGGGSGSRPVLTIDVGIGSIDWSYLFVGLDTAAEDYAERASDALARELGGIDLSDIMGDSADLLGEIANLEALQAALRELGDTAGADLLTAQIAALRGEYDALTALLGTDAVQAWLANEDAAKAAAEAAEAAADAAEAEAERIADLAEMIHDATLAAVEGIAAGGDATGNIFERIVSQYEEARDAFDMGRLLGVPPEVLEELGTSLNEAETLLNEGTQGLREALLRGLIDEETLQALTESGGVWFEQLYDQLFGAGALAEIESGWNDISDASLAQLQELMTQMEDGGASLVDTLVGQIANGAISYEEALALYGDATGEEVNAILEELERMQTALLVDLAEALATGSDPTAIEENLAVIEMLMDSLADKAVETAETVVKAGKSMGVYGDDLKGALEDISETTNPGGTGSGSGTRRSGGFSDGMNNPGFDSLDRNGDGIISQRELDLAGVSPGWRWGLPDVPAPVVTTETPAPLPRSADRSRDDRDFETRIERAVERGIRSGLGRAQ
jgi:hypothetical protein